MKRDFTPENFEDFLKQSADSLRMKAPERVWQNLSKELNKKRRRFAFGLSTLLLFTSAAGYYFATGGTPEQKLSLLQQGKQQTSVNQALAGGDESTERPASAKEARVVAMQPERKTPVANVVPVYKNTKASAPVIDINGKRQPGETAGNLPGDESIAQNSFTPTVVDSYPEGEAQAVAASTEAGHPVQKTADRFPLSIESVMNTYKKGQRAKRFETQLYFTPSSSYRKLTENKSYLRSLNPALVAVGSPALYSSVNSNVTHKPDLGFEAGFTAKYALSDRLKIRSGLQFNINRYDVKAFSSPGSVVNIWLNNGSRVDSLNTFTRYSNISGYKSDWLQNLYFQLSLPVGVEYLFSNDSKARFGIAATIQPTYVLGDRAYLITTDGYKSYTEAPSLTRRWNVNTSLETFVNFQRWQIGPQVRYQLLSSFESKYPVKENLFDFGLKVGVKLGK